MTGAFSSVLKTAKIVPVLRKIQNQIIATIAKSPCYQTLKKYLKVDDGNIGCGVFVDLKSF